MLIIVQGTANSAQIKPNVMGQAVPASLMGDNQCKNIIYSNMRQENRTYYSKQLYFLILTEFNSDKKIKMYLISCASVDNNCKLIECYRSTYELLVNYIKSSILELN